MDAQLGAAATVSHQLYVFALNVQLYLPKHPVADLEVLFDRGNGIH